MIFRDIAQPTENFIIKWRSDVAAIPEIAKINKTRIQHEFKIFRKHPS